MENSDILIVGAGPSGLALASVLAKAGVSFRWIDKNSGRSKESKALGVQAGTLEAVEEFCSPDLAARMVERGFPVRKAFFHIDELPAVCVPLRGLPSRFDFLLILEQSETERLFEENLAQLGVAVERNTELLSVADERGRVRCRIRASGKESEFSVRYVVGCDGAHSVVRHQGNFTFAGNSYEGEFALMDCRVEWPWEHGTIRTFISGKGGVAVFPLRREGFYRLILISKQPMGGGTNFSLEELREWLERLAPPGIRVSEPVWSTRFRLHHRLTEHFRNGNLFLTGDACHIHSPVGGQGMNTGIQDAFNLGSKLAAVLKNGADPALLNGYEAERLPAAKKVVAGTDLIFRNAIRPENLFLRFVRRSVARNLMRNSWVQRKVFRVMSQLDIAREEIARARLIRKT